MRLHYLVKLKIRVFCKNSNARKTKLNKFYLFTISLAIAFTEINTSDHKLAKHYFIMRAELNKYGIQCSVSCPSGLSERKHRVVDKAVDQWRRRLRTRVRNKGQHFEQLFNSDVAFSCWILCYRSNSR